MIKLLTDLLERQAKKKLQRADEKNKRAASKLKAARAELEKTAVEFMKTQADVRLQLNRLDVLENDLSFKIEAQAVKYEALDLATKALES